MEKWTLQLPVWESLLRASVIYLAAVVLMRLIPKRQAGGLAPQDFVSAVVVGGLAAEGIIATADHAGPTDCVLMIAVVLAWNYGLDWLADQSTFARRLIRESPTVLVRDGQADQKAMRREMLTDDELAAQLRKQGIDDIAQVKEARLVADGQVSAVKKDGDTNGGGAGLTNRPIGG